MIDEKRYWDTIFINNQGEKPSYDGWLTKYLNLIKPSEVIVDLGCGSGADTLALKKLGIITIACDFSCYALRGLEKMIPGIQTICFDMTTNFPFNDSSIDVVIADLSLHYFSTEITKKICKEIKRVLKKNGVLIVRVNAIKEYSPSKEDYIIENNYYYTNGCRRRYFNICEINMLFNVFSLSNIREYTIEKYGKLKHVMEFLATKE